MSEARDGFQDGDDPEIPGDEPGDVVEPYGVDEQPEPGDDPEPAIDLDPEPVSENKQPNTGAKTGSKPKRSVQDRVDRWRQGAAGDGEALSRAGTLGWKFFLIMGCGALIAAVVLAVVNTRYAEDANFWQKLGPGSRESLRVILRAPIHLAIGMLAFALTAWAAGVRAGRGDLAAGRIGLAVALAIMALELRFGFAGERMVVYLLAFALYFLTVWTSFRCAPRVAGTLLALHIGLFAAIAGLGWLIVWVGL